MEADGAFLDSLRPCSYLPGRRARLEYEFVNRLEPAEYLERMHQGWRRFGHTLFRPRCTACQLCRPLRIDVARFHPDRSQRRARAANADVRVEIGTPRASRANLDLHDRYHAAQAEAKGWPDGDEGDAWHYRQTFVDNPLPTQEWRYRSGDDLVGVGYVDDLGTTLSAIYFFHDPGRRDRSPGTFNVLSLIDRAATLGYHHVYLGYYVEGCGSMEYKARFRPNQILGPDGRWRDFRE